MFVSKFFSLRAWAPLRGKFSVSRAVVAILQMLLLPKGTLDQRFKNKSWEILAVHLGHATKFHMPCSAVKPCIKKRLNLITFFAKVR